MSGFIEGLPTGTQAWRQRVAAEAAGLTVADSVQLDFVLPPSRWVDVDTLAEATLQGLRDGRVLLPRYAGLNALLATKREGAPTGVRVSAVAAATIGRRRPPGQVAIAVATDLLPRPGNREVKRKWRARLAHAWGSAPPLDGDVWADVVLPVTGSLIAPLEVVLDALEPVLGRDPRGRTWQEFFPNDHRITWLRVRRGASGGPLRLVLGPLPS